jgi:phosphatidylserine/phosphatidylglycerophosphate/cardiolipin synthase-like enzyme
LERAWSSSTVTTTYKESPIDHNLIRQASRSEFGRLFQAGVQIYEYKAAMLHAKVMVVDSR